MLFKKIDLNNRQIKNLFKISSTTHRSSWDHYYSCYNYTIRKILDKGLSKNYVLNSKSKPVLFLIRHNFELLLKRSLAANNMEVPLTHVFEEIIEAFSSNATVPDDFKLILTNPIFIDDGSSLRYDLDKTTGVSYFPNGEIIEVCPVLEQFNSISSTDKSHLDEICTPFDYTSMKHTWDLTFHMIESSGLGILRTQYDNTIEMLITGIVDREFEIQKVYLPLIFLIRHSLELALKFNIQSIQAVSYLIDKRDFSSEHSLARLFNCYDRYLSKIDQSKLSADVQKQWEEYKPSYDKLHDVIHDLDSNSRIFRYPVDKKGIPYPVPLQNKGIIKILELYYFVDPFITFINLVLEEENALV